MPAWWDESSRKRRQNARSRAQERRIAREEGGRVQAGSGSSRRAPQDVVTPDTMLQVKYTDSASYRLTEAELRKVKMDALRHGRDAAMIIEFTRTGTKVRVTIEG